MLKENGVVDSGGFGLAILIDGVRGRPHGQGGPRSSTSWPLRRDVLLRRSEIEQIDDWEVAVRVHATATSSWWIPTRSTRPRLLKDFLATMGDCDLMRRRAPRSSRCTCTPTRPDQVLGVLPTSAIARSPRCIVHNMKLQCEERTEKLEARARRPSASRSGSWPWLAGSGQRPRSRSRSASTSSSPAVRP